MIVGETRSPNPKFYLRRCTYEYDQRPCEEYTNAQNKHFLRFLIHFRNINKTSESETLRQTKRLENAICRRSFSLSGGVGHARVDVLFLSSDRCCSTESNFPAGFPSLFFRHSFRRWRRSHPGPPPAKPVIIPMPAAVESKQLAGGGREADEHFEELLPETRDTQESY